MNDFDTILQHHTDPDLRRAIRIVEKTGSYAEASKATGLSKDRVRRRYLEYSAAWGGTEVIRVPRRFTSYNVWVHYQRVLQAAETGMIPPISRQNNWAGRFSGKDDAAFKHLAQQASTQSQLAGDLGISHQSVSRRLAKLGLRAPNGRKKCRS